MMEQTPTPTQKGKAASLYVQLEADRSPFLERARDCSLLTLPPLIPPDGHTGSSRFYTPFQGIGARGVNNLASKLLLALLPPNAACFRLQIDDFTLEELTQQEGMRAKVEEGLGKIERAVQSEIESGAIRVSAFEAIKHLLVGGNSLVYNPDAGGMRVFPLSKFVVRRDPMGNVLDIVVRESVAHAALPEDVQAMLQASDPDSTTGSNTKAIDLFTHIQRVEGKWKVYQEIKGINVPGSEGTYPIDKSPWIPIRFNKVDGENYGRGYVEEYLGDIKTLEGLSQAIVEGSAAAAKVLFMVSPNGTTTSKDLAEAPNGGFVDGTEQDVTVLQLNKAADFRVALETIIRIEQRLSAAFLLNSSVQRSGERVTAEEIRYMAEELESALGGIYSILSQEFQLPLINRIMFSMERRQKLPALPKGTVKPVIVTGIEALGRGNDMNKLKMFFAGAVEIAQLPREINKGDALMRLGTSLGIDMKGLVRPAEEVAAEMQQEQQQAMMAQGIGPGVTQAGNLMKEAMAAQGATAPAVEG